MILIGQYDSPFVLRVAVTMHHYGFAFEREVLSVFGDFDAMLARNPLGQVPALRLDDGELLFDSSAIIDWLDEAASDGKRLMPAAGPERRAVRRVVAIGLGLAEKSVALRGERHRRAPGMSDAAWVARYEKQIDNALAWLEEQTSGDWLAGPSLTQADITVVCARRHLAARHPDRVAPGRWPRLDAHAARCEALPAFEAAPFEAG